MTMTGGVCSQHGAYFGRDCPVCASIVFAPPPDWTPEQVEEFRAGWARFEASKSADPDKPCLHEDFDAEVGVNRLTSTDGGPVTAYSADIRVRCAQCGEPFRWIGVQAGLKPDRPMVSVDETELHAPIRPASSDPDFGMGIPGFAVTWEPS